MMKLYIASKTKHAPKWIELRDRLAREGIEVVSTWIDEAGPGQSASLADLAKRCINEAMWADVLILYGEPGEYLKGAFIEAGAALANGTRVYEVGQCVSERSTFRRHPLWLQADTVDAAVELACERKGSH